MTAPTSNRITRQDIEAKLRQVRGDVDTAEEAAKGIGGAAAIAAGVGIVFLAYAFGRKKGKRSSTVVEVRRF